MDDTTFSFDRLDLADPEYGRHAELVRIRATRIAESLATRPTAAVADSAQQPAPSAELPRRRFAVPALRLASR